MISYFGTHIEIYGIPQGNLSILKVLCLQTDVLKTFSKQRVNDKIAASARIVKTDSCGNPMEGLPQ